MTTAEKVTQVIRDIPDFPKEGIIFRDITPILAEPLLLTLLLLLVDEGELFLETTELLLLPSINDMTPLGLNNNNANNKNIKTHPPILHIFSTEKFILYII